MAKNYQQEGKVLSFTNSTGSDIAAGDVVVMGAVLAVALSDIVDGESGSVQTQEVFIVPKVSGAVIAQGEDLTWDVSAAAFDDNQATPATGDITGAAAFAAEAAGAGVTTIAVRFTGVPGTVN
ncbi:capsid cement protein [Microbulbifer sp. SAOS-129_SWC]|uniref:DUF2190 family protein n=1 Tax=Microbulbifer sp. SAOS-129_SWC TaxID=3145235 RepID=UPI0032176494